MKSLSQGGTTATPHSGGKSGGFWSTVGRVAGHIWNLPNTIVGGAWALANRAFGGEFTIENGAIVLLRQILDGLEPRPGQVHALARIRSEVVDLW